MSRSGLKSERYAQSATVDARLAVGSGYGGVVVMLNDYNNYVLTINGETIFPAILPALAPRSSSPFRRPRQYHYDEYFYFHPPHSTSDPYSLMFRHGRETTFPVLLPMWGEMRREQQFSSALNRYNEPE